MTDSDKDTFAVSSEENDFYSIDETLVRLGLFGKNGDRTLRRWRKTKDIKELEPGPGGRVRLDKTSVDEMALRSKRSLPGKIEPSTDVVWVSREQLLSSIVVAERMNLLLVTLEDAARREQKIVDVTARCEKAEKKLSAEKAKNAELEAVIKRYENKPTNLISKIFRGWL